MTSPESQPTPSTPLPASISQERPHIPAKIIVRTYQDTDQAGVERLYTEGLLAGQIAANDTGADIENIHEAYLNDPAAHFWVCEGEGEEGKLLGMIGVAREAEHTAEIRRLRVDKAYPQDFIGGKLIETALAHCQRSGYLKVVLDTRFRKDAVLGLFDRFGFQHNRTRSHQEKDSLEFYLDLYRGPKAERD